MSDPAQGPTPEELAEYAANIGLDAIAKGRYSRWFALTVWLDDRYNGLDFSLIVHEIRGLETGAPRTGTKPAAEYKHKPLKGFWHKHYFSAQFLAKNLLNQLAGGKLEQIAADALGTHRSPTITEEMIKDLAHRVTVEQLEQRSADDKLTGEWIVYAKHNGQNYYLTLATHDTGDQEIYTQIKVACLPEFPFLVSLL